MITSEEIAIKRITEYRKQQREDSETIPSLFWAGKMATIGASLIQCDLQNISSWAKLLSLVIQEYNNSIVSITEANLSEDFKKIANKLREQEQ